MTAHNTDPHVSDMTNRPATTQEVGACDPPEYAADLARFMAKVEVQPNGCWQWTAYLNRYGYAQFSIGRKSWHAHRWLYEQHNGPIPPGLVVDHLCRNRGCVNPAHLEAVTQRVNLERAPSLMAQTHCKNGHEFNEENTRTYPIAGGRWTARECKPCHRAKDRRRYWASKNREAAS